MCDIHQSEQGAETSSKTVRVTEAVGTVLAHDITEIRPGEFKGRAFKKGHVIRQEDVCHLQRLGKEHIFVLNITEDEMHEDDAAFEIAKALMGEGVEMQGAPKEGKINIIASRDGLLKIDRDALLAFNMLGEVMCATIHSNTHVRKGQVVAGTRAIPLIVKRSIIDEAVQTGGISGEGVVSVREIRKPKVGIVITGNEVYYGRIKDAFAPIITRKIEECNGKVLGIYYAPDDELFIEARLRELMDSGADLLITTGGMSVDPDDVTRFAIRNIGATDIAYGAAVLPGSMFLIAYLTQTSQTPDPQSPIPVLGIPACGLHHKRTIFDLILPRVLAGEKISRTELAELGHGGLCLNCKECRYPVCPFGK